MKAYFLTLFSASLLAALLGILSPDGTGGGIAKHIKLLTALFLVCVLIAPVRGMISGCQELLDNGITVPGSEDAAEDFRKKAEESLFSASKSYFVQMLTKTLEEEFSLEPGQIRCRVAWGGTEDSPVPEKITVILSGKAIWKDPAPMEAFVENLLDCACETAIE